VRREVLRAKIHRARVTRCDVDYEGSCAVDADLLDAIDAWPFEAVEVYDITNAARFKTYLIPAPRGSGEVSMNGAAAKLVNVGDLVILCCYGQVTARPTAPPIVVLVDAQNRVREAADSPHGA
jgi:aspartate 1-decarboxylase